MDTLDLNAPAHVLLGARAAGYPDIPETPAAGLFHHEKRIGRRVHLGLGFARPGQVPFTSADDRLIAGRANTALLQCWKPARRWREATGNNPDTTAYIGRVAAAAKQLGRPVLLVPHHEPENDVGTAGTPADYRAMYAHLVRVFADAGADNVTWGMGYMNYPKWDTLVPQLWPAATPPRWVFFNAYGSRTRPDYTANVARFYSRLIDGNWIDADRSHWGIREWGVSGVNADTAVRYFKDATHHAARGTFQMLKAHLIFDSPGNRWDSALRLGYDDYGRPVAGKTAAYAEFAHLPVFGPLVRPGPGVIEDPLPGL